MFKEFMKLDKNVLSFDMDEENFYVLSGKKIIKYKRDDLSVDLEVDFFEKEGKSRFLIIDDDLLYCKDFIMFYVINKSTLNYVHKIKLGEDLKSDICGITFDKSKIYTSLRNGPIAVINKSKNYKTEIYDISDSSLWDITTNKDYLYGGNVEGELIVLEKNPVKKIRSIKSHKQNLKSILVSQQKVITASQDKSIYVRDLKTLETILARKKAHNKMFRIVSVYKQFLVTVSFPCGEIKFWDINSLTEVKKIKIPNALSGVIKIEGDNIYLASRSIKGIMHANLKSLI